VKRLIAVLALAALASGSTGCGGGSSPSSSTPTSPIARAILLVTQTSVGLVGLSTSATHALRLSLPVEIRVTNNTACNLNYARLRLLRGGVEIERAEVTATDIVALAGTNRVTNERGLVLTIRFDFNSTDFDSAAILLGATDDAGNSIESVLGNLRIEVDPSLQ
jgi:hypothetical protein